MSIRITSCLLATVAALGLSIPATAGGPSMSTGSSFSNNNPFGNTNWNWSVNVPWDYGYNGSAYYYGGGMSDQQLQYAMLQQQWAAAERERLAMIRMQPHRAPKEPKANAPAPQRERPAVPVQVAPPADPSVRAANKLRLAQLLAEDGKSTDAAEYYAEIIQKYPGTPAAAQAQQLLDKSSTR